MESKANSISKKISEVGAQALGKISGTKKKKQEVIDNLEVLFPRDEAYYRNAEYVKQDLEEYARVMKKKNVIDVSYGAQRNYRITCKNGENVRRETYLLNASKILGVSEKYESIYHSKKEILSELFKISGYELPEYTERDKQYYSNKRNLRIDLKSFLEAKNLKYFYELDSQGNEYIVARNNESIGWNKYITHAGVALGLFPNNHPASKRNVIFGLLEMIGEYIPRDLNYYTNHKYVKKDLIDFAHALNKSDPRKLSERQSGSPIIICSKEKISWVRYLNDAGKFLNYSDKKEIINKLLKTAGYQTYIKRDISYYTNTDKILSDLELFAKASGKTHLIHLNTVYIADEIICASGEKITWSRYLTNAGVVFGYAKTNKEAGCISKQTLEKLKKIAGVVMRDGDYYNNKKYVQNDLKAFANSNEKIGGNIKQLVGKGSRYAICSNGERVNRQSYLSNAGVMLGLSEKIQGANKRKALDRLLEITGYKKKDLLPRDSSYYQNAKNIYYDLGEIAKKQGKKSIADINTTPVSIVCKNGEQIRQTTYISNAGIALGIVSNSTEGNKQYDRILKVLQESVGESIFERDLQYYSTKDYVMKDLIAFSKLSKKETYDLNSSDFPLEIKSCSGKHVKLGTYLSDAGISFGIINKRSGFGALESTEKIRKKLHEIGELEYLSIEIKSILNKHYFINSTQVREDLEMYAKAANKYSVLDLSLSSAGISIKHKTGAEIKFGLYIVRAGIACGFIDKANNISGKQLEILTYLKSFAGYESLDKNYFRNKHYVQKDLNDFSHTYGRSVVDLHKFKKNYTIKICNGIEASLNLYLSSAGVAFGVINSKSDLSNPYSNRKRILSLLMNSAGYEQPETETSVEQKISAHFTINPQQKEEIKQLIHAFGYEHAAEILYQFVPEYSGLDTEMVKGALSKLLGEYKTGGYIPDISDIPDYFDISQRSFQQTIKLLVEKKFISHFSHKKRTTNHSEDEIIYNYIMDLYEIFLHKHESQHIYYKAILNEVAHDLISIVQIQRPSRFRKELKAGRAFPDLGQKINAYEVSQKKRFVIADEMGLGKTLSSILAKEYIHETQGRAKKALVIVPAVLQHQWKHRLGDGYDPETGDQGYFQEGKAPEVALIQTIGDLKNTNLNACEYVVISSNKLGIPRYVDFLCEQYDFDFVIVDEIHKQKNLSQGKQAQGLIKISNILEEGGGDLCLLSGTPIPNTVKDIAMLLKLLYPVEYRAREEIAQDNSMKKLGSKNLVYTIVQQKQEKLKSLILSRMQQKKLTDYFEMPEISHHEIRYPMLEIEKTIYEGILEDEELSPTVKIDAIRKLLLNPSVLGISKKFIGSKAHELNKLLKKIFQKKGKVVVFVNGPIEGVMRKSNGSSNPGVPLQDQMNFSHNIESFSIHGGLKDHASKLEQQQLFWSCKEKAVIYISGSAGDVGIDLSCADTVIHLSEPWTLYDKQQQLARVYRYGLEHEVDAYTLIAKESLEEGIYGYIRRKRHIIEKLLNSIPVSEEEIKEMMKGETFKLDSTKQVQHEVADFFLSNIKQLNRIWGNANEQGEERAQEIANKEGVEYSTYYRSLGRRSYQSNANRVNATIIKNIIENENLETSKVRILDMGSSTKLLQKHIDTSLQKRVWSLDINPHAFSLDKTKTIVSSFLDTPCRSNSYDIVSSCLSYNETRWNMKQKNYERLQFLLESNRILKEGGQLLINTMYSSNFSSDIVLDGVMEHMGFAVDKKYTGHVHFHPGYKGNILVLKKIKQIDMSYEEILKKLHGSTSALKLKKVSTSISGDIRKVLTQFSLNDQTYDVSLNKQDQYVKQREECISEEVLKMKKKYEKISNIPNTILQKKDYVRYIAGKKYKLLKVLENNNGIMLF